MDSTEPAPTGLVSPLPKTAKILVEDQVFIIEDPTIMFLLLGKLRSTEGGSYRLPNEWNVRPTQFSILLDHLQSRK